MVKLNKKIFIFIIAILFLAFIFSIIFAILNINNFKILNGISINGIDISNKTKEEAISVLTELINNKKDSSIKVYYNENIEDLKKEKMTYETNIKISELDVNYDINSAVNEAYNIGRGGNIFENNINILNALIYKKNIEIDISIDEKSLSKTIENISSKLPDKLIQSSYYIDKDNLIITKGIKGNIIKVDEFKKSLLNVLKNLTSIKQDMFVPLEYVEPKPINVEEIYREVYKEPKDAYYQEDPFKVYKEVQGVNFDKKYVKELINKNPNEKEYKVKLKYTNAKKKLDDIDIDIFKDLLGSFSTIYDEKNKDRTNNLNLATKKINGIILSPGEEFSYNKIVGKRSIAAGYKESKIYSNGQVIYGLGGGICQISSTLYNAVMFANLEVTERHGHQFITSYVDAGRDATVVYGAKDFKFVNNRTYPIKINMTVNSGVAKVEIYGIKEEKEYNISFDVETISIIEYTTKYENDNSLKQGEEKVKQKGVNGLVVKTYKVIKQNGIIIARELISEDTYNALNKIILRGI